ncbi:hypothetical protein BTI_1007 [Burkholderia thailandensis MSMB121]|uniref:hypothetical protein n=1 Tax=Burkholderia TaxID=32008 RepID=UPI000328028F|nr:MULTISPECIES: hypothetical protein [Burkholderia]AGK47365.1 hypothetical protein BTI_1007 [Burkholderia thailandensis MSMB121]ATF36164.1 hypothetical protein CO709_24455 [Burkholderia thailandensis]KST73560.1 hypothetical protein WS76_04835 [Burkholderia humptydooensis]
MFAEPGGQEVHEQAASSRYVRSLRHAQVGPVTAGDVPGQQRHEAADAFAALELTLDDDETALLEAAFERTLEPAQW